ncbi:MAG TPA: hypothetical protein VFO34_02490 [Candidatus Acidoferrales bacterium]|nr:hypothetical protein [Candidatus Acidoferrales bacterium]
MHRSANPDSKSRFTRREFGRGAVAAVAAAALAPASAISQRGDASAPASPQQGPDVSDLSPAARAEIDAKVENAIRRWGDRMNDEQKTRIRTIITRHVRMLETVRKFAVKNGDSPASVLKLFTTTGRPQPSAMPHAKIPPASGAN